MGKSEVNPVIAVIVIAIILVVLVMFGVKMFGGAVGSKALPTDYKVKPGQNIQQMNQSRY